MVEIRDFVVWAKHIHGNPEIRKAVESLDPGELIELRVNSFRGMWGKMENGKDGRPTPGIKPIGKAREQWHSLYADNHGDLVSIAAA